MIGASDLRAGVKVEIDGEPYLIVDAVHVKPAKGGAFVRTKFRNLRTGNQLERTHRVVEKFDEPEIEERRLQYLYAQGEDIHFMDSHNYEQLSLTGKELGDSRKFLKENMEAVVMFYKGRPIGVTLPNFVELLVADTGCGVSADDKEKLFLPYFSTKGRGTGLGLAIVSHILAEHGGRIRVEDNRPVGARFYVELPAAAAETAALEIEARV